MFEITASQTKKEWAKQSDKTIAQNNPKQQFLHIILPSSTSDGCSVSITPLRGFDSAKVQEVFELPDGTVPSLMLALGYPSEKSKPAPLHTQREPIEEFVIEL